MAQKYVNNHTFSYLLTMDEFRNSFSEEHRPSWVKLSTITIISNINPYFIKRVSKTDYSVIETKTGEIQSVFIKKTLAQDYLASLGPIKKIDIPSVKKIFKGIGSLKIYPKNSEEYFDWKILPPKKNSKKRFFNQVTIGYTDIYSKKSVKLFSNGSIQVAGCSDLFDCQRVIRQINFILKLILKIDATETNFKVVMINTNFSLNYNINLMNTVRLFRQDKMFLNATFKPDKYSAVKIKFKPASDMKQVTTSIFSTGKIIITGAETLKEIVFAYNLINQFIHLHRDKIKVSRTTKIDTHNIINGYTIESLIPVLKKKEYLPWTFVKANPPVAF